MKSSLLSLSLKFYFTLLFTIVLWGAYAQVPGPAGSISGTTTICEGGTATYTVAPISGATGYSWVPSGGPVSFVSGGGTNSVTISFPTPFPTSGITLTVRGANSSGLGPVSPTLTITVFKRPGAPGAISGPTNVCAGQTGVTYSVSPVANATNYIWTTGFSGGGGASPSTTINFPANYAGSTINVFPMNGPCTGPSSSLIVSVQIVGAAGAISGSSNVCPGYTNVAYSVPAITNATGYVWNLPPGASIASGSNTRSITVNYSGSAASGNISVYGTGCSGNGGSSSLPVTVTPLVGAAGSIGGTTSICEGSSATYTVPTIANATAYSWVPSGGPVSMTGSGNSVTVSFENNYPTSGITLTVRGANICGLGPVSAGHNITVYKRPGNASGISGSNVVCPGQTGVAYSTPAITNAGNYLWTLPTGATIASGANTNSITVNYSSSFTGGTMSVVGLNGPCGGGNTSTLAVSIPALPSAATAISGSANACPGYAGVAYSVPPITNATGYVWTLPPGASIASGSNTRSITVNFSASAASGNISVYGTNCSGNGPSSSLAITISQYPGTPGAIGGTTSICEGSSATYTVPAIANATSYSWVPSGGPVSMTGSGTNSVTVSFENNYPTPGISLTVRGANVCGLGPASAPHNITVYKKPGNASAITGSPSVCPGQNGVAYSIPPITNASNYLWTMPAGTTIASGANTNSITVNYSSSFTGGTISVVGLNGPCGGGLSSSLAVSIPTPSAAGTISGSSNVCPGHTAIAYSVPAITNATGYVWTLPSGASIASGSNTRSITVNFSGSAASGNISVYGTSCAGNGASSSLSITVTPLVGAAGAIVGTTSICEGSSAAYSVPAIDNATGYSWVPTGGPASISGSGNSVTVSFENNYPTSGITLTVRGANSCGLGPESAPHPITVYKKPGAASAIAGSAVGCPGQNGVPYSIAPITNVGNYVWALPTGATLASGSNTNSITVNFSTSFTGGTIAAMGVNGPCGAGPTSTLPVSAGIVPGIAGTITATQAPVCQGQNGIGYSVPVISDALEYVWTLPDGTSTTTTNSVSVNYPNALTGNISVYGKRNTCTGGSSSLPVTVNPAPAAPSTPTLSPNTCGTRTLTRGTPPAGVDWFWQGTNSNGQSTTSSGTTYPVSAQVVNANFYLRARYAATGCWSLTSASVPVTVVNPSAPNANSFTHCEWDNMALTTTGYPSGGSLKWFTTNEELKATGITWTTSTIQLGNHTFRVRSVNSSGCTGESYANVTVNVTNCDIYLNWTQDTGYGIDGSGTPIAVASSKNYLNGFGELMQYQTKSYSKNQVIATQPIKDVNGNPSLATLAAPINYSDFVYRHKFVTNDYDYKYNKYDFDLRIPGVQGEPNLPRPVSASGGPGTLGWYYSTNNSFEPQTPITSYPYARTFIQDGPDPKITTAAGPGEQHKMGSTHEVISERQKITATELNHYYALRPHFVTAPNDLTIPSAPGYKFITTDPNENQMVTFMDINGRAIASATLTGTTLDNWSYAYYNDLGQLMGTVAPKGVNTASSVSPAFATRYKYDFSGRVIEINSTEEGISLFTYSRDGKLRFSQNQEQRDATPKRFSYTNYDYLGRVIESGEYTMSGTGYFVFETHNVSAPGTNSVLIIANNTGFTGITKKADPNNRCSEYTFIEYDYQAVDLPTGDALHAEQTNLTDVVSKTENATAKTWYSYDEFDRLLWSKQYIAGIGYKSIDYTYDFLGQITEVAYQKGQADAFFHHYTYDADQRLSMVHTSKDGVSKVLRARYHYYLHGPLKRAELGGNVQGMDYVYTIDGSLKALNNAEAARDPGADGISGPNSTFGKDVFGMTMHYYDGDYAGANYNAGPQTIAGYQNQFGGTLKALSWHNAIDNNVPRTYAYTYDNTYQLTEGRFGDLIAGSPSSFNPSSSYAYQERIPAYDKNGNISSLQRRGKSGALTADYSYIYESATNKLDKINHAGSLFRDYTYDVLGQMSQQVEGMNTTRPGYNVKGLTKEVRDGANQLRVSYTYDDSGNKVQETEYTNGVASKNTFYVYDAARNLLALYEQTLPGGTVQLTEVPVYGEGRIALHKPAVNTYFYEIGDHQGNVRSVIGLPETISVTATLETANMAGEQQQFLRYENVRRVNATVFDHTNAAGSQYSMRLSGSANEKVGLARSVEVSPGDKLTLEVFAKYVDLNAPNVAQALRDFLAAVAAGTTSPGTVVDGAVYPSNGSTVFPYTGFLNTAAAPGPKAFLNYLFFDRNFNFILGKSGFIPVTEEAKENGSDIPHQRLFAQLNITEPGYVYTYLSNDNTSPVEVYFDDFTVTHEHSPVVAGADYYPYGLVMENREITDEPYRYGYQGQFSEKDLTTDWNEFQLRNYDARIGRWTGPDPYGQYASQYVGMGNSPVMGIDPDGGFNWGATAVGAVGGFAVGSLVGLAVDQDNWWKYGIVGAAGGAIAGATSPDLTIHKSASGWVEFRAEVEAAVTGNKGSVVSGRNTYFYAPGPRAYWQTLANVAVPTVRQSMTQWCVFGCSESLNRHFGGRRTQRDFSRTYNGGVIVDRGVVGDRDYGRYYVGNFRTGENGPDLPAPDRIRDHLRRNHPISIKVDRGVVNGQRFDHNMIIKGIQRHTRSGRYRLLIMDPAGQIGTSSYRAIDRVHRYFFVILGI
jgi:RHS repeat-associated protein